MTSPEDSQKDMNDITHEELRGGFAHIGLLNTKVTVKKKMRKKMRKKENKKWKKTPGLSKKITNVLERERSSKRTMTFVDPNYSELDTERWGRNWYGDYWLPNYTIDYDTYNPWDLPCDPDLEMIEIQMKADCRAAVECGITTRQRRPPLQLPFITIEDRPVITYEDVWQRRFRRYYEDVWQNDLTNV